MFFPKNYTVAATASSLEKTNPQAMFDARASLLGNTMEILTMSWVLFRLAVKLGYLHQTPTMSEIAHGEVWKYHVVSGPVSQKSRVLKKYLKPENQMVWWVMSHADNRGSDVRLDAGTLLRPDRIQRTSINSAHWIWKSQLSFRWRRRADHINEKEARAAFTEVKRRARLRRNLGSRYLHLLDSSVAQGVLTKHRSTSFQLQRVVRRQCAVELIAQIKPIYAFVRSSMNPADWPSRRPYARFKKDHKRR